MSRTMSRVAVVAIVVFAFILSSVPASAAPQGGGKAAVNAESGWFQSALAWFNQVIFGGQPAKSKAISPKKKAVQWNGSCVDPFGRCG
jgi:hypothetical protein